MKEISMARINPFRPNSPIAPGMFVGRIPQLTSLEQALLQTRAGSPKNFILIGERGIGKTSLLNYLTYIANGLIEIGGEKMNFLVINVDVDSSSTDIGLIQRIQLGLNRELEKTERARSFMATTWKFLQRVEGFGMRIRDQQSIINIETLHDEFAHSLALTANRICRADAQTEFCAKYDGILLLIDEADNAPSSLQLGAFSKLLTERMQRNGCNNFMLGIAGLLGVREVLRNSHASSLRIFDELLLQPLSRDEISAVIDRAISEANENNSEKTAIDEAARNWLINLSEGFPHFIQQFGYSAFERDSDGVISAEDVTEGAFGLHGAMEKIGDRFYRDDFYNKIQKESYRQVLRIMAKNGNQWISKPEIRKNFRGKETTLDNALHALRERKIILAKEGQRGTYRLQHMGFAFWIMLNTTNQQELEIQLNANVDQNSGRDTA